MASIAASRSSGPRTAEDQRRDRIEHELRVAQRREGEQIIKDNPEIQKKRNADFLYFLLAAICIILIFVTSILYRDDIVDPIVAYIMFGVFSVSFVFSVYKNISTSRKVKKMVDQKRTL